MFVIFLFPLIFSIVAAAMAVIGEYGNVTKIVVSLIVIAAACLQFVPALQASVHFLVRLFMQLIICGWWYFASQFE